MCNKCYSTIQQDLASDVRQDLSECDVPDEEIVFDDDCVNYGLFDDEDD